MPLPFIILPTIYAYILSLSMRNIREYIALMDAAIEVFKDATEKQKN